MAKKYKHNSLLVDFLEEIKSLTPCTESLQWHMNLVSANPKITLGESINEFLADKKAPQGWAVWTIENCYELLDPEVRKRILEKVTSASFSFHLYVNMKGTTQEDDLILARKFSGKLPEMEKKLLEGKINRNKN